MNTSLPPPENPWRTRHARGNFEEKELARRARLAEASATPVPPAPFPVDGPGARPGARAGRARRRRPAPGPSPFVDGFPGIVARSRAMRAVLATVERIAASDAAVLIEGESGTGKELIARAIHRQSPRATRPFVTENCAACPPSLLESEFFGVEKGAYTGASTSRPGVFERVDGGTLFLDEIGEMDTALQAKLLRVLQEREVRRIGGEVTLPVRFRLVSATNRDLRHEVSSKRFRLDLLYRLDVVTLSIPPLRERTEDIPSLANHFLITHAQRLGRRVPELTPEALGLLVSYGWPGNVREIENEMWRAVSLDHERIRAHDMSEKIRRPARDAPREALDAETCDFREAEREILGAILFAVLRRCRGNCTQAAQIVGLSKSAFYRRLQKYGLNRRKLATSPRRLVSDAVARYSFLDHDAIAPG